MKDFKFNFKEPVYKEGQKVVCTLITPSNYENLKLGEVYTILGYNLIDDNVVYALLDKDGNLKYSIDRFKPYEDAEKEIVKEEKVKKFDIVEKPMHYNFSDKFEVIDIIEECTKNLKGIECVCIANTLKYIMRYQYKNGKEDLKKAVWYLNKIIDKIQE